MTNSEARKRQEESATDPRNIVETVLDGNTDAISLQMSMGEALLAAGDLMSAALQLLAQAIQHMSNSNDDEGETA